MWKRVRCCREMKRGEWDRGLRKNEGEEEEERGGKLKADSLLPR